MRIIAQIDRHSRPAAISLSEDKKGHSKKLTKVCGEKKKKNIYIYIYINIYIHELANWLVLIERICHWRSVPHLTYSGLEPQNFKCVPEVKSPLGMLSY